ncbi:probable hexosyltransferase MUCI70 isoform X1 [Rosa rugosa]|uniref:probable hexosyltransferase MUCI70 isoform X1 n=2 Tax=Rosa rugosa TaxID=74645 RepID=UPI002B4009F9|nr:probable hexosyltransferase MUCI70 isoform X1 [Rosa rugosa]XP_062011365.1 probable hexosyltransferase MUCI70 isoform X1 [Rosa rugosa]
MTGGSLGLRTGSYGSLQLQQIQNGFPPILQTTPPPLARKPSKVLLASREKERVLPFVCRFLGRKKVIMLLLVVLALLVFVSNSFNVNKGMEDKHDIKITSTQNTMKGKDANRALLTPPPHLHTESFTVVHGNSPPLAHQCENFAFPPPPPSSGRKRSGPRPCPVCYLPVEQAIASMPSSSSESPVLHNLTYVYDENPTRTERHGGSEFGGFPTLRQRNDSYDIKESMTVHCGFVKGNKPGDQSGFDVDEADLMELETSHEIIVASAVFGNYDIIQQPTNISEFSRKNVPFYMFIDEETEAYMKNSSVLGNSRKVGLWRVIVVRNVPYTDARRNGKIPKLLLHRLFPNVRYSVWIDGKLQLVVDPYQVLERFLWRQNANFAISKHYRRYDVFEEAEANRAAGKYDNSSINEQVDFYIKEGLQPYSEAKLPITSDVPEGCVIIKEHIPITNLFTCNWFNEVDRFTSRDQLSFSTVRDKIMGKVDWSINMFLDCERRNFVIQAYHRELLEQMPPPRPPRVVIRRTPALPHVIISVKTPPGKKRGRGDKKRHRKVVAVSRDNMQF